MSVKSGYIVDPAKYKEYQWWYDTYPYEQRKAIMDANPSLPYVLEREPTAEEETNLAMQNYIGNMGDALSEAKLGSLEAEEITNLKADIGQSEAAKMKAMNENLAARGLSYSGSVEAGTQTIGGESQKALAEGETNIKKQYTNLKNANAQDKMKMFLSILSQKSSEKARQKEIEDARKYEEAQAKKNVNVVYAGEQPTAQLANDNWWEKNAGMTKGAGTVASGAGSTNYITSQLAGTAGHDIGEGGGTFAGGFNPFMPVDDPLEEYKKQLARTFGGQ